MTTEVTSLVLELYLFATEPTLTAATAGELSLLRTPERRVYVDPKLGDANAGNGGSDPQLAGSRWDSRGADAGR